MAISPYFPTLEVDLSAIQRNWKLLAGKAKGDCAAVVKANAYGLGVARVAPALVQEGCREFFVATLEEGIELRRIFSEFPPPGRGRIKEGVTSAGSFQQTPTQPSPFQGEDIKIYVFHGLREGEYREFAKHALIPVINSPAQFRHWEGGKWALHVDTGMNRLGVTRKEVENDVWRGNDMPCLVMSHLACANDKDDPKNALQLAAFKKTLAHFPGVRASLANSSGVFLGKEYHFDLARPGCSLYGISPDISRKNPMEHVARLSAPVLQYRMLGKGETVGYGGTGRLKAGSVIATVELGYADGLMRSLSNKGEAVAAGVRVPIVGRVSMDMVAVDVSNVPEEKRTLELRVTFIGKEVPVDEVAKAAGTIGYEVFTRLGSRVRRLYPVTESGS